MARSRRQRVLDVHPKWLRYTKFYASRSEKLFDDQHFTKRNTSVTVRATSGKCSGRVESPLCTLGGSLAVNQSRPYFCPVRCAMGRRCCRHESGTVLAAPDAELWLVPAQSGCRLPGADRWETPHRRRATFQSGASLWSLGHSAPCADVAPGGRAGGQLARPWS
jgi:hypothetical protein